MIFKINNINNYLILQNCWNYLNWVGFLASCLLGASSDSLCLSMPLLSMLLCCLLLFTFDVTMTFFKWWRKLFFLNLFFFFSEWLNYCDFEKVVIVFNIVQYRSFKSSCVNIVRERFQFRPISPKFAQVQDHSGMKVRILLIISINKKPIGRFKGT